MACNVDDWAEDWSDRTESIAIVGLGLFPHLIFLLAVLEAF